MIKGVSRIFKWVHCLKFRAARKLSDHRATSKAFRMVVNRQLGHHRAVPSVAVSK